MFEGLYEPRRHERDQTITAEGVQLLSAGWEPLLKKCFPKSFTGDFASFHREFWDRFWATLWAIRHDQPYPDEVDSLFPVWPRGGGKSTHVECAAVVAGIVLGGYTLYVCSVEDQAVEHVLSIRGHLERSEVARYFPGVANPKVGEFGNRSGWRQDFVYTRNGWGARALGLDSQVRGTRLGEHRPNLIIFDDIDDLKYSMALNQKHLNIISKSIIPAAAKKPIFLFAQNLIHRNSVLNRIVSGDKEARILQNRKVFGPVPALKNLVWDEVDGKDVIVSADPTWSHFDMDECRRFLARSGKNAFLSEYQHDLNIQLEGLIFKQFDPDVHVISWSEFERIYGYRQIPAHWIKDCACDWGSTGQHKHPCVLSFVATSSEDSPLPGLHFLYKGKMFADPDTIADDVGKYLELELGLTRRHEGDDLLVDISSVRQWIMSHEAKSERDTLRRRFGVPFKPADAGKRYGISQMQHYLRVNYLLPNPFRPEMPGFCRFYWIVDDDQLALPQNDKGLKRWRDEIVDYRWVPIEQQDRGINDEIPVKFNDDAMDTLRMLAGRWMPPVAALTYDQRLLRQVAGKLHITGPTPGNETGHYLGLHVAMGEARKRADEQKRGAGHWADEIMPGPRQEEEWLKTERDL